MKRVAKGMDLYVLIEDTPHGDHIIGHYALREEAEMRAEELNAEYAAELIEKGVYKNREEYDEEPYFFVFKTKLL